MVALRTVQFSLCLKAVKPYRRQVLQINFPGAVSRHCSRLCREGMHFADAIALGA